MASPSYTYTLTNGTTADASQVMQNFNDILNGITDGTKDLSISALTVAGTATLNGHVNIGNASGDDLTITASLASAIAIKTNNTYDIGSSTKGLRKLYLGNGGAGATCDIVAAAHATTREYTVPDCGAAADFVMTQVAQSIAGAKTFSSLATFSSGISLGNETLSVYDEGTFTPTITGSGGAFTSVTYANQSGSYTRIGRLVFFSLRVDWSAASGGTGNLYVDIGTAPAMSNTSAIFNVCSSKIDFGGTNTQLLIGDFGTTSKIAVETYTDNGVFSTVTCAHATDAVAGWNKQLFISGCYVV